MTKPLSPQRWANEISIIVRTALGADRFPIDVREVAREISKHKFPDDPITMIRGDTLPGFEGALAPAPPGKKGWGIIYNSAISSTGRINFTLGSRVWSLSAPPTHLPEGVSVQQRRHGELGIRVRAA